MALTKKVDDTSLGLAGGVAGTAGVPGGPGGAGQLAIPAELKERVSGPNFLEAFGAAMQARGRERQGLDAGDSLDKLRASKTMPEKLIWKDPYK